jgi:site-specific DNA-cytosine methylase
LKAVIIENVRGILNQQGGNPSFMTSVINFLEANIPEFAWDVTTLKAEHYLLAQQRTRVFLRAVRVSIGGNKVPAALNPFGHKPLHYFLDQRLPPVDWSSLTLTMTKNLKDGIKALKEKKRGIQG